MKKLLIILIILAGSLHAHPLYAATKKIDRASLLSNKTTIENTYNKSIQDAKLQFDQDIAASKSLKGKPKSHAVKAAAAKRQKSVNSAKDMRKKQLKELSSKK